MKSTIRQHAIFGIIAFVAIMIVSLASCTQPGGGDENPATYTITQTGGSDNTTTSTGISFTFSKSVDSLTVAEITMSGKASKGSATLTGSGTSWTLSSITVSSAGLVNVSINKDGIEAGTKSVTVYYEGQTAPTETVTINWNFNGGTAGTGAQHPPRIDKGDTLAQPSPAPTKAGNTFGGWYTDSALTQAYNFSNTVTTNLNLYAKWEEYVGNTEDDFIYEITGSSVTIIGYKKTGGHVEIPATIEGKPVTTITAKVEQDELVGGFLNKQLTSVTIPDSVTSIGDWAFYYNQLTSVTIPNSVTSIGEGAFAFNQLTSVTIGNSVTSIGVGAFYINQLTSVTIPDSVTSIGGGAFSSNQLTSVTIGADVTIPDNAFNQISSAPFNELVSNGFVPAYNTNNKAAGTYTRPNTDGTTWTKQPDE